MLLEVPVEPVPVVVVLVPVSVPDVVSVSVPVVSVSVPVPVSFGEAVQLLSPETVYVAPHASNESSESTVVVLDVESVPSVLGELSVPSVLGELLAVALPSVVPPMISVLGELLAVAFTSVVPPFTSVLGELLAVVSASAVPPGFDSPHAVSAIPSVIPSVASEPPRAVPHGAWQKGQVIISSNT